ncbi:hypothetical protein OGAPHI_000675 [Ogataea philodendri]|uniref:Uncharacterized protein n=1 Tax=Ogataea philodendri TaxID=1378263 RepID=A0A9P8PGP9_9ASCO|nr:uncharacterized protein OGAPHI_000675 [Ogataea philodendri]KAH3670964.1 hypothetical protein OGAPHI_000675 [Ogataea philodendri]
MKLESLPLIVTDSKTWPIGKASRAVPSSKVFNASDLMCGRIETINLLSPAFKYDTMTLALTLLPTANEFFSSEYSNLPKCTRGMVASATPKSLHTRPSLVVSFTSASTPMPGKMASTEEIV